MQYLIDFCDWNEDSDLVLVFCNWGGYVYGQNDYGIDVWDIFSQCLFLIDMVVQNQDNCEYDVLDFDDYY